MNTRHFKEAKDQIQQIWQSQTLGAIFFTNMCNIRFYKGFCKDKTIEFQREEVLK
jgi:hypothetical protein